MKSLLFVYFNGNCCNFGRKLVSPSERNYGRFADRFFFVLWALPSFTFFYDFNENNLVDLEKKWNVSFHEKFNFSALSCEFFFIYFFASFLLLNKTPMSYNIFIYLHGNLITNIKQWALQNKNRIRSF